MEIERDLGLGGEPTAGARVMGRVFTQSPKSVLAELDIEDRAIRYLANLPDHMAEVTSIKVAAALAILWEAVKDGMLLRGDQRKVYVSTAEERAWLELAVSTYSEDPRWESCPDDALIRTFSALPPDAAAYVAYKAARHICRRVDALLVAGADDWRVQRLSLLRTEKGNSLLDETGIAHLESLLDGLRPDVLVLDPLVAFCGGGNVNDNAVMSLVMRAVKRLATKFDCAVLVIHHTRKGGDLSNAEAISGASAIVNLARRAIMAVPMTADEAKQLGCPAVTAVRILQSRGREVQPCAAARRHPLVRLCDVALPNPEPPSYPIR